jgi:hypothetical protein
MNADKTDLKKELLSVRGEGRLSVTEIPLSPEKSRVH